MKNPFNTKTNEFEEARKLFKELESRKDLSQATFGGGCFWCMEGPFEMQSGVEEVISGYTGGNVENPTYGQVTSGSTGHTEAVRVYYDENKINYDKLLEIYWIQIDPTDTEGQFADRGEQYRTGIYYHNEKQKELAEEAKQKLEESGVYKKPIVVPILPVEPFYPAEDYHQDFYKKSSERYKRYKKGSGRKDFIEKNKNLLDFNN